MKIYLVLERAEYIRSHHIMAASKKAAIAKFHDIMEKDGEEAEFIRDGDQWIQDEIMAVEA